MSDPNSFKFDVRVRERMIARGILNEQEVQRHLASLIDAEATSEPVEQSQPALGAAASIPGGQARPATHVGAAGPASDEDLEAS